MADKRLKSEEIVTKLRQVDVIVGEGIARVDAIREGLIIGDLLPLESAFIG